MEARNLGKVIMHEDFISTIKEIKEVNLNRFQEREKHFSVDRDFHQTSNGKVSLIDKDIKTATAKNGEQLVNEKYYYFGGYDESTFEYTAIEGSLFLTSHSYTLLGNDDWESTNFLTNYFITRSKSISEKSTSLIHHDDPSSKAGELYAKDRSNFLMKYCPNNSILFVDGPLIGGQKSYHTISMVEQLQENGICPIFFVKNSNSNLVTDNISQYKGLYNSDMHWSSECLKPGEYTNWFKYTDRKNIENTKVFTYLKIFKDVSPQRIELHPSTFNIIKDQVRNILDCIYYFALANGSKTNPQIRPIAVAEKFARESKNYFNLGSEIKIIGLTPSMNQERGF